MPPEEDEMSLSKGDTLADISHLRDVAQELVRKLAYHKDDVVVRSSRILHEAAELLLMNYT